MRKILSTIAMCIPLFGGLQAAQRNASPIRAATNTAPIRVEEEAKRNTNSTLTNLHELNYQGWIAAAKDTTGAGITGTMGMIFRLYSESTGGKELWSETQTNIQVDNGLFNAVLGSVKPIPTDIFTGASLWLETQVGDDILTPRKKLASVGYAIKAEKATHSDTADFARSVIYLDGKSKNDYKAFCTDEAAHNHLGQSWEATSGGIGLAKTLTVSTTSDIYCEYDGAYNNNTGTGNTYGGYLEAGGSGTGNKFGLYSKGVGPSGSSNSANGAYGYAMHLGSGTAYGMTGSANQTSTGDAIGGYFAGWGSGEGGKRYGVYCEANGFYSYDGFAVYGSTDHTSTGKAYGGYFEGKGSGTGYKYGLYSGATAPAGSSNDAYGVYGSAQHAGSGPSFAIYGNASNTGNGNTYGGYFEGKGSGTGAKVGVRSIATAPAGSSNPAYGVYGGATNAGSGDETGGYFEANGSGTGTRRGSWGKATSTSSASIIGSEGEATHTGGSGSGSVRGVYGYGSHSGTGYAAGGYFSAEGAGSGDKYGIYTTTGGSGTQYGLYSTLSPSTGSSGYGVYGSVSHSSTGASYGVYGSSNQTSTGVSYGGYFEGKGSGTGNKKGVWGYTEGSCSEMMGVHGDAISSYSNEGDVYGGYFYANGSGSYDDRYGVLGWAAGNGSYRKYGGYFLATGDGTIKYGVYSSTGGNFKGSSSNSSNFAGYFGGNVGITGISAAGNNSLLIDHPLDPMNKTLRYNSVESPENLCLYKGKVKLNANGEATVEMPNYFAALTKENEAIVTLTPIGKPFQVGYEWQSGNTKFTVYGEANKEISYTVLADRDDPVIKELRKPVEEYKGKDKTCEKGELLYPRAYSYSETLGKDYKIQQEQLKHNKKEKIKQISLD
ncbi:MAG: hypothetical protein WC614_05540 [bacterium]